jgi:hypothetical protein
MDNCLKDYVGLLGCGSTTPKSGLYLNDLPGISTELVAAVTPKEVDTYLQLWERINSRSWQRIQADTSKFMLSEKKLNINTVAYQTQRLRLKKPLVLADPSLVYEGVEINAPATKYGKVSINGLQFYSTLAGTTTLKVIDALTLEELLSLPDQIVEIGPNFLEVNQEFGLVHDRLWLLVVIDATALILQQTDNQAYGWYSQPTSSWGVSPCACWDGQTTDGSFDMFPVSYEALTGLITVKRGQNNGVMLSAELGCGTDTYLCENKKHFAVAWQHLLGAELMKEKRGSYKLNFFANTNLEMTAERETSFTADYEKYLKLSINRIPLDSGQLCFNCEGVPGYRYDSLV